MENSQAFVSVVMIQLQKGCLLGWLSGLVSLTLFGMQRGAEEIHKKVALLSTMH